MVENGTGCAIVLQFAHLGSSALAFETLEQGAHARLETHNWMHQWGRHGRCWSSSSFEQSCETDAGRTEHRLCCGQSETQILASCADVGDLRCSEPSFGTGRPTEWALQVRKDLEALACQVSGHLTPEEMSRMAINSTDAQRDTVVRELLWDMSCVDPVRHVDTITSSSITCTECIGSTGETRQFMSAKALLCHQRTKHGFRNPMRFFADDDGVCGVCGANFRTRLRLLDHFFRCAKNAL